MNLDFANCKNLGMQGLSETQVTDDILDTEIEINDYHKAGHPEAIIIDIQKI